MNTESSYLSTAQAYADGVRVLFAPSPSEGHSDGAPSPSEGHSDGAPSGAPTGERGGRGPASPDELAEQAERLAPLSAELTQAASARLTDADPAVRAQASTQLLAKALTDLEISAHLLQAAEDQADGLAWAGGEGTERSAGGLGATEERLSILLGEVETGLGPVERGGAVSRDLPTARVALSNAVEDALDLISQRASRTGQAALGGLLGLGVAQVAQAAGVVGLDIARSLGQAEKVTRLYNLFRDFAVKAYDSLIALLGQQLAQTAAQKVVEWFEEIKEGEEFGKLLERLYDTQRTGQELGQLVAQSPADLDKFTTTAQRVDGLEANFAQQIDLSEKLLQGLKYLSFVPAAALPQGRLLMAAAYIVLGAYVVWAGGDYVDARHLERLDRVPGVRHIVETHLAAA